MGGGCFGGFFCLVLVWFFLLFKILKKNKGKKFTSWNGDALRPHHPRLAQSCLASSPRNVTRSMTGKRNEVRTSLQVILFFQKAEMAPEACWHNLEYLLVCFGLHLGMKHSIHFWSEEGRGRFKACSHKVWFAASARIWASVNIS